MVQKEHNLEWDEETDIVVIGSGLAGLAAAIEAKNAGCSVIVLEKMKGYGGNSSISDGVMFSPPAVMMMSFLRSVMNRNPSLSTWPTSPVYRNPSSSRASVVASGLPR